MATPPRLPLSPKLEIRQSQREIPHCLAKDSDKHFLRVSKKTKHDGGERKSPTDRLRANDVEDT
jgi:hypothetical protein